MQNHLKITKFLWGYVPIFQRPTFGAHPLMPADIGGPPPIAPPADFAPFHEPSDTMVAERRGRAQCCTSAPSNS